MEKTFQHAHAQNVILKSRKLDPKQSKNCRRKEKSKIIKIKQHENEGRILTHNDLSFSEPTKRRKKDVRNALHYILLIRMFAKWVYSDMLAKTYWLWSQVS